MRGFPYMMFKEREIKIIELASYVAQQIQTGQKPADAHLDYLCRMYQSSNAEADLLRALLKSLDVPQLERLLRRMRSGDAPDEVSVVPGREVTLYKTTLPGEVQARVATDSLIARYLSWLARHPSRRAVALVESDRHVVFFVPEGSVLDPEEAWNEFVRFAFSIEELIRTFVAMLNTIHLSERETGGFQVPNFPIISHDSRLIILAWLLCGLEQKHSDLQKNPEELEAWNREIKSRIDVYLEKQAKIYHEISEVKEQLKHESNLKRRNSLENKIREKSRGLELSLEQMDQCKTLLERADGNPFKFLELYRSAHPIIFAQAKKLSELYTRRAARQIGWRKNRMADAIIEIVRLVSWSELYQQGKETDFVGAVRAGPFRVKPLLLEAPETVDPRPPGDNTDRSRFCYVCGRLLSADDRAEINRLIFESPSQRLQSSGGEKRPAVCYDCVVIALASPLKPSKQSVIIRLESVNQDRLGQGHSAAVLGRLESFLRGLTLDITTYSFVPPTTLSGFLRRLAMMSAGFDFPNTGPNDQNTPFYVLPRELVPLGAYPVGACSQPAHRTYRKGPRDLGHKAFSDLYRGKASGRENIQLHTWEYLLAEELVGYVVSENEKELARLMEIIGYGSKMGKEGYAFVESASGPFQLQRAELKAAPSTFVPADDLFEKNPRVPADIFTLYSFIWLETEGNRIELQKKQGRRKSTPPSKIYSTSAFDKHPSPVVKYKPFPAARVDGQTGVALDYLHYDGIFIPISLIETLRGGISHE